MFVDNPTDAPSAFLHRLFASGCGYVRVGFLDRATGRMSQRFFPYPHLPVDLDEIISAAAEQYECYFSPFLYRNTENGTKASIADEIPYLWADADTCHPDKFEVPPSIKWESSPGRFHVLWKLEEALTPEQAENLSKRIAYYYAPDGCDTSGWDLSQFLRIPGTLNHKYNPAHVVGQPITMAGTYQPSAFDIFPQVEAEPSAHVEVVEGTELDVSTVSATVQKLASRPITNGEGEKRLYAIVCQMYEDGHTQGEIVTFIEQHWAPTYRPRFIGRAPVLVAKYLNMKRAKDEKNDPTLAEFTDARLAETVSEAILVDKFCWTAPLGWMKWTGKVWQRCPEVEVINKVREYFINEFVREVKAGCSDERRKSLSACCGYRKILPVTRLAQGIVQVADNVFDRHPELLNTPSGIIDLRTKRLIPHDPNRYFTKITAAGYEPNATHPDWEQALTAIPDDIRDWYQIRLGQGITGDMTPDDVMVVSQGGGENGKTTIYGGVKQALGEYFVLVAKRALLADARAHTTELMDFRGARVALLEETPQSGRLSVTRLKDTVGTPEITARHMRKNSVTYQATHSLFLSTNYRPIVEETDHGTWRRLLLVRFPYRYRKHYEPIETENDRSGDPTLRDRVLNDAAVHQAALAWLVDGAHEFYRRNRIMPEPPERVLRDTREWRKETDIVLRYFEDYLELDSKAHIWSNDLRVSINQWLEEQNLPLWTDKAIAEKFRNHGELSGRVESKRIRPRAGLWRPVSVSDSDWQPPVNYYAWLGVRFKHGRQVM